MLLRLGGGGGPLGGENCHVLADGCTLPARCARARGGCAVTPPAPAPLQALASRDGVDRVAFLLDRRANPNASPGHGGRLPFAAQALTAGLADVCALLLRRGAHPAPLARWQLHRSSYLSLASVTSVLQEAGLGLEVTADDAYELTLLHTAVVLGDISAARTVLDHCSDAHVARSTAAGDSALALALKVRPHAPLAVPVLARGRPAAAPVRRCSLLKHRRSPATQTRGLWPNSSSRAVK